MTDKTESTSKVCICGYRPPEDSAASGKAWTCPQCGERMGEDNEAVTIPSAEETQTVNLEEMARMAQEGVDVTASGEWDTSLDKPKGKEPEGG